jgi:hypothetical protein
MTVPVLHNDSCSHKKKMLLPKELLYSDYMITANGRKAELNQ